MLFEQMNPDVAAPIGDRSHRHFRKRPKRERREEGQRSLPGFALLRLGKPAGAASRRMTMPAVTPRRMNGPAAASTWLPSNSGNPSRERILASPQGAAMKDVPWKCAASRIPFDGRQKCGEDLTAIVIGTKTPGETCDRPQFWHLPSTQKEKYPPSIHRGAPSSLGAAAGGFQRVIFFVG